MKRVISDTKLPVKIWASDLEPEAEQQVRRLANLPFIYKHVAVMPDAHAGKGSTVGTVIATTGAIIPAAVGVDIGCGMSAIKLPFQADQMKNLPALRHSIERAVPTGRFENKEVNDRVAEVLTTLGMFSPTANSIMKGGGLLNKAAAQLGSLGGGNHFIEVCLDTQGGVWVVLHSGSRNVGNRLAQVHMNAAKNLMKQYFIDLPDPDLAFLVQGTPEFKEYMTDLQWAQRYAAANRSEMMLRVVEQVYRHITGEPPLDNEVASLFAVNCHHNYTSWENFGGKNVMVTRKGAVSAREGEWGIIPGSMGTRSYIVKGKGNLDSFCSCSHGAGRKMSRTQAKKVFTVADLEAQTLGVECRKDKEVLDEIPGSYKDIDEVMANQVDLVDAVYELKQIICVKGAD